MEAYTSFAEVYDNFMDNIPYADWCGYLTELLHAQGVKDGIVADLGCGTGTVTRLLRDAGYDMIGIDSSCDMLDVAREKEYETDKPASILYLLQDIRELELYGTVAAFVSICDTINYITEPEELLSVFRLVNNYLDKSGVFIFDFHPEAYYRNQLGGRTFAEDREDMSFIWENSYDEEAQINTFELNLFMRRENGLFEKYSETHRQRGYTISEMKDLIAASGMELVAMYDAFTKQSPREDSERIYVIVRERPDGKKQYID